MGGCGDWSAESIPDLEGQRILVTGSNRGLGYASIVELARKNCEVIMTARTLERGEEAAAEIRKIVPKANLTVFSLDLSSFKSVRDFAAQFKNKYSTLTVLLNNAGLWSSPDFAFLKTEDGLEACWQANFYAPLLLTSLLLETLVAGGTEETPSRVVMISSFMHLYAKEIDVRNPEARNYARRDPDYFAYPGTKLADLFFATTLHEKLERCARLKGRLRSVCAHPGWSSTDLNSSLGVVANALFGMRPSEGCLSLVRAAVDPSVRSGEYVGPNTWYYSIQHLIGAEMYGAPTLGATRSEYSKDSEAGLELWTHASEKVGAKWDILEDAA